MPAESSFDVIEFRRQLRLIADSNESDRVVSRESLELVNRLLERFPHSCRLLNLRAQGEALAEYDALAKVYGRFTESLADRHPNSSGGKANTEASTVDTTPPTDNLWEEPPPSIVLRYKEAIGIDPLDSEAYESLGFLADICDRYAEAEQWFRQALAAGRSVDSYIGLVEALFQQGKTEAAREIVNEVNEYLDAQKAEVHECVTSLFAEAEEGQEGN